MLQRRQEMSQEVNKIKYCILFISLLFISTPMYGQIIKHLVLINDTIGCPLFSNYSWHLFKDDYNKYYDVLIDKNILNAGKVKYTKDSSYYLTIVKLKNPEQLQMDRYENIARINNDNKLNTIYDAKKNKFYIDIYLLIEISSEYRYKHQKVISK